MGSTYHKKPEIPRFSVKEIQEKVNKFYYILGFDKRIKEDGIKGIETVSAIKEVQSFLKKMKLYKGRIDGKWENLTESAYDNFMSLYKTHPGIERELMFERFYYLAGKRLYIFLQELKHIVKDKYNVSLDYVYEYLKRNEDRIIKLYKKTVGLLHLKGNKDKNNMEIVGHVVLSAVAAEAILNVKAEVLLSIAVNETHIRNVFGKNGQGIMQITRNSSVSHLKGYWLDRVNGMFSENSGSGVKLASYVVPFKLQEGKRIKERIKYNEVYRVTNNIFAAAETILLKMAERRISLEELDDIETLKFLAMSYNGHPDYMFDYGRKFVKNYKNLV